jgi:protein gp37
MSDRSSIEWTDATWNPVRGCTKISPGCTHCYAKTFAERFQGVPGHPFEQGFALRLVPEKLVQPMAWSSPRRVFVNSMSDLFHENVPDDFIAQVGKTMRLASWHTYQVLTKRPERMLRLLTTDLLGLTRLPNVWWGVSVENRKHGLPRIDTLRSIPVENRFLSVEPLLEELGPLSLAGIRWVIVGGESGRRARPMKVEWVRNLRDQCRDAKVPFFFKQWGGERKHLTGRHLDGRLHNSMPRVGHEPVPGIAARRAMKQSMYANGD